MMKIQVKKKNSLSISSAKPLRWWRGRGGPKTAPPRGQKPVNIFNYFFSKTHMVQSSGFATPSG